MDLYLETLIEEIRLYSEFIDFHKLQSIYLGGGTPSLLLPEHLKEIFTLFPVKDNMEITIETNPESLSYEKLKFYKEAGINRLSVGIQSILDKNLITLGRNHRTEEIYKILDLIDRRDFSNMSLDFIYNIPGQTMEDLEKEFDFIRTYNPKHISFYGLLVEEKTAFFNLYKEEKEDDLYGNMYLKISKELKELRYEHYEISNFCKEGYTCRHNQSYWNFSEYLGLGPSAASYINGERFKNPDSITDYINNIKNKKLSITEPEKRDERDILLERIFLGLRTNSGLNLSELSVKYNFNIPDVMTKISEYIPADLWYFRDNSIFLTAEGFLSSNTIILEINNIISDKNLTDFTFKAGYNRTTI